MQPDAGRGRAADLVVRRRALVLGVEALGGLPGRVLVVLALRRRLGVGLLPVVLPAGRAPVLIRARVPVGLHGLLLRVRRHGARGAGPARHRGGLYHGPGLRIAATAHTLPPARSRTRGLTPAAVCPACCGGREGGGGGGGVWRGGEAAGGGAAARFKRASRTPRWLYN